MYQSVTKGNFFSRHISILMMWGIIFYVYSPQAFPTVRVQHIH